MHYGHALTPSQTANFTLPKLKEFADDNFKVDENGRKLSTQVENTVETLRTILLFSTIFSRAVSR